MKSQRGLTLVELMVTLAVAIILLSVGMPLFNGVVANNRAVTHANTFVTAFKLARSEAVRRGQEVSVCAIKDLNVSPVTCVDEDAQAVDWSNGVLVFSDTGTLGEVDGDDERLRVFEVANDNAVATTEGGGFVAFQGRGAVRRLSLSSDCPTSGTCIELDQTDASEGQTRCLHVMLSGQVRLNRGACS